VPIKSVRRFQIVDAMVLVAAVAFGCALVQLQGLRWTLPEKWFPSGKANVRPTEEGDLAALIASFLIPLTVALLALRLGRPRPSRRRLLAQPGFAACAIATVVMILISLEEYRTYCLVNRKLMSFTLSNLVVLSYRRMSISYAPAGLWFLMAACGRWHAEPSWIDRAGRIIGAFWIVLIPLRLF
jgi:hypothetical protein